MGNPSLRTLASVLIALLFLLPAATVVAQDDENETTTESERTNESDAAEEEESDETETSGEEERSRSRGGATKADAKAYRELCDANDDDFVDEREFERCGREALAKHCDFNGDGRIDPAAEARRCRGEPSGGKMDGRPPPGEQPPPEERSRDGRPGPHPCEREERADREECMRSFQVRCDRGAVAPENAHHCKRPDGAPGEHGRPDMGHARVSDACRAELEAQRRDRESFHAEMRAEREAFAAEQKEEWAEFAEEEHTEEEWREFRAEQDAERRAFEEEMRAKADAWEAEHRPAACEGQGAPAGEGRAAGDCRPSPEAYERFKSLMQDEDARFRADVDARYAKFQERQERQREAFLAGEPGEEDIAEFEDAQRAERARFEGEIEERLAKHRAHLEGRWHEFQDRQADACLRADPDAERPKPAFREVHASAKDDRFACQLEAQAELHAFYEEHGRDADAWDEATLESYVEIKREAQAARKACESRLHESWKAEAKEVFAERAKKARFGDFQHETTGEGTGTVTGRFVAFEYEGGSLTLRDYTVAGLLVFEELYVPHDVGEPRVHGRILEGGGAYAADDVETSMRLRVHDNPSGGLDLVCAKKDEVDADAQPGDAQACWLSLPDGAEVERKATDEESTRYAVTLGDARAVLRVAGPHYWGDDEDVDEGELDLEFFGALHVHVANENFVHGEFANKHRERIVAAVEEGRVLAEVDVVVDEDGEAAAATTDYAADDVLEEGETSGTEVEIEQPDEGDGVVIEFDAESSEGKTVVFNLDAGLFEVEDLALVAPADFKVSYWEVGEDGTETEVEIAEADSITDVLDPDEDAPEYWVVVDKNGIQLLVSNPHFSTKRVAIQSGEVAPVDGSGAGGEDARTPFPGLFAAVAAVGAVAWAARRRAA